ncbi:hypothetical protein ACODTT_14645 [Acinetobacter pittii]|uniref:hypothetical protein n=1 Tax=Acinetobacter pittii TaxID=48296 RepID=UPI003B513D74
MSDSKAQFIKEELENDVSYPEFPKHEVNKTLQAINTLKLILIKKREEMSVPIMKIEEFDKQWENLEKSFSTLESSLENLKNESALIKNESARLAVESSQLIRQVKSPSDFLNCLRKIYHKVNMFQIIVSRDIQKEEFLAYKEDAEQTVEALKRREEELVKSIEEVKTIFEQTKNLKIHDYYDLAAKENQNKSDINRVLFISLIFLSLTIIWFSLVTKGYFGLSGYDYYFFKGSLVLTSITLITYFLKQSVKYQKMADQCKQTKLELEAFPSYVSNLSNEDPLVADLRKELAMKYFGRDVDNKSNDETSNILQDQMKNTTEMVKAAMEVLKKSGNS